MASRPPRIFVSAGEPSGDLHAGRIVSALRRRQPDVRIDAFGGPALVEAGANVRFRMEAYTAMGFFEILAKLPRHLRLLHQLRGEFRAASYDLVLTVDYPGFNLRLAGAAHDAGLRTLGYIAPQLWAWRPGRAQRLTTHLDRLAVILPFEPAFFASLGVRAEFVGHPLVERTWPTRAAARGRLGIPEAERVLAVFPGSREQEIARIWPVFRDAAARLLADGACQRVLVAVTPAGRYDGAGAFSLVSEDSAAVLAAADAALAKSGTTTLEAAMTGTPMVVAYRVHALTAAIARRVIRVPWISLVNLVAGRAVVPELLQDRAGPADLAEAVRPLLHAGSPEALAQQDGLALVRSRLGTSGAADRVAAMVLELLAA
jgi:lipid-A-disaccharide synthase